MSELNNYLIDGARSSAEHVIKAASFIPAEHYAQTHGGETRSVHDILVECATFPHWIIQCVEEGKMPEFDPIKYEEATKDLTSLESIRAAMDAGVAALSKFIEGVSAEKMKETMTFPWGTYNVAQVLGFFEWNNTYHLGQVNYVQRYLGDKEMHM